jgi:hypothetical protein
VITHHAIEIAFFNAGIPLEKIIRVKYGFNVHSVYLDGGISLITDKGILKAVVEEAKENKKKGR